MGLSFLISSLPPCKGGRKRESLVQKVIDLSISFAIFLVFIRLFLTLLFYLCMKSFLYFSFFLLYLVFYLVRILILSGFKAIKDISLLFLKYKVQPFITCFNFNLFYLLIELIYSINIFFTRIFSCIPEILKLNVQNRFLSAKSPFLFVF